MLNSKILFNFFKLLKQARHSIDCLGYYQKLTKMSEPKEPKKKPPLMRRLTWQEIHTIRHSDTDDVNDMIDGLGLTSPTPNPEVSSDINEDSLKYDNV